MQKTALRTIWTYIQMNIPVEPATRFDVPEFRMDQSTNCPQAPVNGKATAAKAAAAAKDGRPM